MLNPEIDAARAEYPDDRGVRRRDVVTEPAATRPERVAMRATIAAGLVALAAMVGTFTALPVSQAEPGSRVRRAIDNRIGHTR